MISCVLWKVSWIIFGDGRLYPKQRKWHLTASKRWNYETTYLWMSGTSILYVEDWVWGMQSCSLFMLIVTNEKKDQWGIDRTLGANSPHFYQQLIFCPTWLQWAMDLGRENYREKHVPFCACSSCCAARFSPLRTDVPNKTCPLAIEWNAG